MSVDWQDVVIWLVLQIHFIIVELSDKAHKTSISSEGTLVNLQQIFYYFLYLFIYIYLYVYFILYIFMYVLEISA